MNRESNFWSTLNPASFYLVFLTLGFTFSSAEAFWGYSHNHYNDSSERDYDKKALAVIGIVVLGSMLLALSFVLCRHFSVCSKPRRGDLDDRSNIISVGSDTPGSGHNFNDVILSFAGPQSQMTTPAKFIPFYQQDLSPPPPYHLAIHYPPLQTSTPASANKNTTHVNNNENTQHSNAPSGGIVNPNFNENIL